MKERLFALLLAAVMVLSLGMAAVVPEGNGDGTGSQQTTQAAPEGQKAPAGETSQVPGEAEKTPGKTEAPEDTVPGTENGTVPGDTTVPDDTTASDDTIVPDDTTASGDAAAPEDTTDGGADKAPADDETAPPPDQSGEGEDGIAVVSAQGEAVPAAVQPVKIVVTGDTGKLKSLKYGEQDLLTGGDIQIDSSVAPVDLEAVIEDGYWVEYDKWDSRVEARAVFTNRGTKIEVRDCDGDGTITIKIVKRPQVTVKLSQTADVKMERYDLASGQYVTIPDGSTVYVDQGLKLTVPEAYGVASTRQYNAYQEPEAPAGEYQIDLLYGDAKDGDTVIIQVAAMIKIEIKNSFEDAFNEEPSTEPVPVGEERIFGLKGGYTLQVAGGYIGMQIYDCAADAPEVFNNIHVYADGSATTMTLTVVEDKNVPKPAHVTYQDAGNIISEESKKQTYVMPGNSLWVDVKDGYLVEAKGGQVDYYGTQDGYSEYLVYVDMGATEVTVSTSKLATDATIHITPTDAVVSGDGFVTDGVKLTNGRGRIKVKNGYDLSYSESGEIEIAGGVCTFSDYEIAGKGCSEDQIYEIYDILATTGDVTVKLVPSVRLNRWVKVTVQGTPGLIDFAINPDYIYSEGNVYTVLASAGYLSIRQIPGYTVTADAGELTTDAIGDIYSLRLEDNQTAVTLTVSKTGGTTPAPTATPAPTPAPTPVPTPDVSASATGTANDGQAKKQLEDTVGSMIKDAAAGKTPAGLDKTAADAVKKAVEDAAKGQNVDISTVLTVEEDASVSTADETLVEGVLQENETVAGYLDINIVVKVNGTASGHVTETDAPIAFAVDLPDDIKGPIIYVVRVHDGKAEALTTTVKDGKAYFSSDKFSTYAIVNSSDIANASVGSIPDQTYTGKAITPAVTVTVQGPGGTVPLKEGTDYTVTYKNNVEAGTATVVITGKAPYTGTKEVTFKIVKPAASGSGSGTGAKTAPQTGDETPIALYAGILALSAGALALTAARRKKTSR